MIPHVIHYVWVGPATKPEIVLRCIESWKRFCPGWEFREWGDDLVNKVGNRYVKEAYAHQKWAFVSDWMRLYVLEKYGGFYLDTDMEILKPIDEFCANKLVMGLVNRNQKVLFNGGFIGCEAGDPRISSLLADYDDIPFVKANGELDLTPNTDRMVETFASKWGIKPADGSHKIDCGGGVIFYPHDWFLSRAGYTFHHYCASWVDDWLRKVWLSVGHFKIVRFKRRKEISAGSPKLLKGERSLFMMRFGCRKKIALIEYSVDSNEIER